MAAHTSGKLLLEQQPEQEWKKSVHTCITILEQAWWPHEALDLFLAKRSKKQQLDHHLVKEKAWLQRPGSWV